MSTANFAATWVSAGTKIGRTASCRRCGRSIERTICLRCWASLHCRLREGGRTSELGHCRPVNAPPTISPCPLRPNSDQGGAWQRNVAKCHDRTHALRSPAHYERQKITSSTRRGERVYSRKGAFHVLL